jgi:hypothetical protein
MVSPLWMPVLGAPALIYWPQDKGLRAVLATMIATMRRFDAACKDKTSSTHRVLFPLTADFSAIKANRSYGQRAPFNQQRPFANRRSA